MRYARAEGAPYSPVYFLSSLGAGGLAVSFFMYLMWMTPHKGQPIPSFSTLSAAAQGGDLFTQAVIAAGVLGIAFFTFLHVRTLLWNVREYFAWKKTPGYQAFLKSNNQSQLTAMPLAFAMSINVGFIVGAVFVPGLWEIAEYLFPAALLAFAVTGYFALKFFGGFFTRVLTEGGFDCTRNNSFGQLLSAFSLAMVGVGFSAAAAMSHVKATSAIGFMGSTLFLSAAVILGAIFLVMGFRSMMEHSAERETTPTLWIIIPFITVVGIAVYRLNKALEHNFGVEFSGGSAFALLTVLFSIQLVFGLLGYMVMKRFGYFEHFVTGEGRSPGSYALICPGVALFVFGNFVINAGLVQIGVIEAFSIAWFVLYVPLVYLQVKTIAVYFRLNGKLLGNDPAAPAAPMPA
ncbi:TsoY family (seleno)protein [Hoeflea sp.]|uniref:TsoY family (seleno)protein n=1 Tax=Hoeflea sp. TaxID=1940281 RepID=UPI003B521208